MIFEVVKGGNDSTLISNGKEVKVWDFSGKEIEGYSIEIFNEIKEALTYERIEYDSFEEAKEAFNKFWKMITYKKAEFIKLNRVTKSGEKRTLKKQ